MPKRIRDRRGPRGRDGSALIVLCLSGLLGLAAVFGWQAYVSARSHRAAAEAVVRDYASLAADELVRRSLQEIGYRGFYTLISSLQDPQVAGRLLEDPTGVGIEDPGVQRARGLASFLFVLDLDGSDLGSGELRTAGAALTTPAKETLIGRLAAADPSPSPYGVLRPGSESSGATLVYARRGTGPLVGFAAEPAAYGGWFRRAFEAGSLLPPAIAGGVAGDELGPDRVAVEITMADGSVVFTHGEREVLHPRDPYAPDLASTRVLGDDYEGVLEGFTVRLALDQRAAEALVIGGLPRNRLPLLLVLFVLTAGLLTVALLQLRRSRALTRLREEFVARVSHELRTPLAQIRMFSETLLLDRVRSSQEARRSLEILDQEARRLSHLVDNVLQFSGTENGRPELDLRRQALLPLLHDLLERCRFLLPEEVVLRKDFPGEEVAGPEDEPLTVTAERDALQQVLLNLLDNAVKYGPRGQSMTVGAGPSPQGRVRIWVEDQGPGVPMRARKRIWESFQRLDQGRRQCTAGTGIGLAVVRDLVQRQAGRVWVENGAAGGARFIVELPA